MDFDPRGLSPPPPRNNPHISKKKNYQMLQRQCKKGVIIREGYFRLADFVREG